MVLDWVTVDEDGAFLEQNKQLQIYGFYFFLLITIYIFLNFLFFNFYF